MVEKKQAHRPGRFRRDPRRRRLAGQRHWLLASEAPPPGPRKRKPVWADGSPSAPLVPNMMTLTPFQAGGVQG